MTAQDLGFKVNHSHKGPRECIVQVQYGITMIEQYNSYRSYINVWTGLVGVWQPKGTKAKRV